MRTLDLDRHLDQNDDDDDQAVNRTQSFYREVHTHLTTKGNNMKYIGFLMNIAGCLTPLMMKTYLYSVVLHIRTTNQPLLKQQKKLLKENSQKFLSPNEVQSGLARKERTLK